MIKILIGDEENVTKTIREVLGEGGMFEFHSLSDGLAVYTATVEQKPHLCLLSLTLPNVTGYEIYREIRGHQSPGIRNMPIVFLGPSDAVNDLKPLGKDRGGSLPILTKPLDRNHLIDTVEAHLEGALAWERFERRLGPELEKFARRTSSDTASSADSERPTAPSRPIKSI